MIFCIRWQYIGDLKLPHLYHIPKQKYVKWFMAPSRRQSAAGCRSLNASVAAHTLRFG